MTETTQIEKVFTPGKTGGAAVYVESDGNLLRFTSSLKYDRLILKQSIISRLCENIVPLTVGIARSVRTTSRQIGSSILIGVGTDNCRRQLQRLSHVSFRWA